MRRQTVAIIALALIVSIALGFLIGQLAGGNGESTEEWTPAPTIVGTPASPVTF